MTEFAPPRRSSPLSALRERWRLGVVVTAAGLLLGVIVGGTRGASYTAEARVSVGTGSLSASAVAGYTIGVESVAADYARAVTTDDAKSTLAKTLGDVSGITAVNASPIPSSAVIRVDVSADSSALALRAVSAVTTNFVNNINTAVGGTSPTSVLAQYNGIEEQLLPLLDTQTAQRAALARAQATGTQARVTAAEQAVNATSLKVNNLSAQATALLAKYQTLVAQPQAENGLQSTQSAYLVGSNRHSLIERWALIGLVLGALLALALAAWADTQQVRRRRLRAAGSAPTGPAPAASAAAAPAAPAAAPVTAPSVTKTAAYAEESAVIVTLDEEPAAAAPAPVPVAPAAMEAAPAVLAPSAPVVTPVAAPSVTTTAAYAEESAVIVTLGDEPAAAAEPGPAVGNTPAEVPEPDAPPVAAPNVTTTAAYAPESPVIVTLDDEDAAAEPEPESEPDAVEAAPAALVVPAEGDLTLVSLAEGEALPAPLLELSSPEPHEPAVHPDQLEVIPEPVMETGATEATGATEPVRETGPTEPTEPVTETGATDEPEPVETAGATRASEPDIPTAPEPAAYDLDDIENDDPAEREPVLVPQPVLVSQAVLAPRTPRLRPMGPTDW